MLYWLALLAGGLVSGACLVAAMVLPRPHAIGTVPLGAAGFLGGLYALGTLSRTYSTALAIAAAVATLIAGIVLGYTIATSAIPNLARMGRSIPVQCPDDRDGTGIVVLACTESDRYDPRAIAYRQELLREQAAIDLPLTAIPFVFLAEKTRYRAVGNTTPGAPVIRSLLDKLDERAKAIPGTRVDLAPCHRPEGVHEAVAAQACSGVRHIAVVALDPPGTITAEAALASLRSAEHRSGMPLVVTADTIWGDQALARRMADRILASTAGAELEDVGVALVSMGMPEEWARRHRAAAETENYFNQRVRMALMEAGIEGEHIRSGSLEWQAPDVTEMVRHLAALGCRRIIVAPSTAVLPTLDTTLDLERAATYARVPPGVRVITLGAWGDDDVVVQTVLRVASAALERSATSLDAL